MNVQILLRSFPGKTKNGNFKDFSFFRYGTDQANPVGVSPTNTELVWWTTLLYHITWIVANNFSFFDITIVSIIIHDYYHFYLSCWYFMMIINVMIIFLHGKISIFRWYTVFLHLYSSLFFDYCDTPRGVSRRVSW